MPRKSATQIIDPETPLSATTMAVPDLAPGSLEEKGYVRVTLPELPAVEMMYVRNRSNVWHNIASQNADVPDLMLPPHSEDLLRHHGFWVLHPTFRGKLEDKVTDEGAVIPAEIQVFQRTKEFKAPKAPPANVAVDGPWLAPVQQIVYAPFDEASEYIEHDPMIGPDQNIRNIRFLAEKWIKVLKHALFVCKDNRRCGKEVDQRRIDALSARIDLIVQWQREGNIVVTE